LPQAVLSAALLKAQPDIGRSHAFPSQADDFPSRLATLRQARGLTGEQLATRIGVSRQALWYWETGRRTPRPEQLAKIAAELQIDPSEFSGEAGDGSARSKVVRQCKRRVAQHYGVETASVRILVEL
jgi:transcriptional regulator with XRE-family HTH domain